ncbi:hypothetical protein GH893_11315 [Bacillus thuringiensis]|nr:hypothetical protein [Bacillus thuringiensis]OTW98580.1 hypothetical protein BK711_16000 [Bacillus thuringiensis serovar fukuokaensis]
MEEIYMRGARPIKPSKKMSFRGRTPSIKTGKMIHWESLLEHDFVRLLEFDPFVTYYESQPLLIQYSYLGKRRKYYPDFKVITNDEHVYLYEVKAESHISLEENMVKFEVGRRYCEERKWFYRVITEKEIRKGFLIENICLIQDSKYSTLQESVKQSIIHFLQRETCITINHLLELLTEFDKSEIYTNTYAMIYDHLIKVNLIDELLTSDSVLSLYE